MVLFLLCFLQLSRMLFERSERLRKVRFRFVIWSQSWKTWESKWATRICDRYWKILGFAVSILQSQCTPRLYYPMERILDMGRFDRHTILFTLSHSVQSVWFYPAVRWPWLLLTLRQNLSLGDASHRLCLNLTAVPHFSEYVFILNIYILWLHQEPDQGKPKTKKYHEIHSTATFQLKTKTTNFFPQKSCPDYIV